jgi:hypothetical protein
MTDQPDTEVAETGTMQYNSYDDRSTEWTRHCFNCEYRDSLALERCDEGMAANMGIVDGDVVLWVSVAEYGTADDELLWTTVYVHPDFDSLDRGHEPV